LLPKAFDVLRHIRNDSFSLAYQPIYFKISSFRFPFGFLKAKCAARSMIYIQCMRQVFPSIAEDAIISVLEFINTKISSATSRERDGCNNRLSDTFRFFDQRV
jgi:hypothetical protein